MGGGPRGFTLLEALIASAIFAAVMAAVYAMYVTNRRLFLTGESLASAQQNARVALEDMTAAVRMAGGFHPDPLCRPAASNEAVRITAADTLSLHGGYRDPDPGAGPGQDCNVYVTYSLWTGAGRRGTTLLKETRRDPWDRGQLVEAPLAEGVTRLLFRYFDADGHALPTWLPDAPQPACPEEFPVARPFPSYALDGQGPVTGQTRPAPADLGSERSQVHTIRIELRVEMNIAGSAMSGCFRHNVGGSTQGFELVSEAHLRGLSR